MPKDFITPLDLEHFDVSTITNLFQLVTDTGFSTPCSALRMINASNISIAISYNGIDDHDYVIHGKDREVQFQTNSEPGNYIALMPKETKIWVRAIGLIKVPKGMFYFTGF